MYLLQVFDNRQNRNRCWFGLGGVIDAFRHSDITVAETRVVDETALSDGDITQILKNIRERSRGNVSSINTGAF